MFTFRHFIMFICVIMMNFFFRFIHKNATLAKGGNYESEEIKSTGFALYTDAFIETLDKRN